MNLTEARRLALDLMKSHGLIVSGWSFAFDNAVKRLGLTKYKEKRISLSRPLTKLNEVTQVKNTILHEIAHALVGVDHGHNEVWRFKAVSIGCNGQRCTNAIVKVKPRYMIVCGLCLTSWPCHRRPRGLDTSYHSNCGRASKGRLSLVDVE